MCQTDTLEITLLLVRWSRGRVIIVSAVLILLVTAALSLAIAVVLAFPEIVVVVPLSALADSFLILIRSNFEILGHSVKRDWIRRTWYVFSVASPV